VPLEYCDAATCFFESGRGLGEKEGVNSSKQIARCSPEGIVGGWKTTRGRMEKRRPEFPKGSRTFVGTTSSFLHQIERFLLPGTAFLYEKRRHRAAQLGPVLLLQQRGGRATGRSSRNGALRCMFLRFDAPFAEPDSTLLPSTRKRGRSALGASVVVSRRLWSTQHLWKQHVRLDRGGVLPTRADRHFQPGRICCSRWPTINPALIGTATDADRRHGTVRWPSSMFA
jgi:hypothetical protein